jgi:hypothetical protein
MGPLVDAKWEELSAFFAAAVALINTPRLTSRTLRVHKRPKSRRVKFDEQRASIASLQWIDVRLLIDKHETTSRGDMQHRGKSALHTVRSHLRFNSFGGVSLVRSHLRGDPTFGVRKKRYGVARIEDEGAEWKGGILPSPQKITEFEI